MGQKYGLKKIWEFAGIRWNSWVRNRWKGEGCAGYLGLFLDIWKVWDCAGILGENSDFWVRWNSLEWVLRVSGSLEVLGVASKFPTQNSWAIILVEGFGCNNLENNLGAVISKSSNLVAMSDLVARVIWVKEFRVGRIAREEFLGWRISEWVEGFLGKQ